MRSSRRAAKGPISRCLRAGRGRAGPDGASRPRITRSPGRLTPTIRSSTPSASASPSPERRREQSSLRLEIRAEVGRRRRTPAVEGVGGRMIRGAPGAVGRDLVDVAEILGEAMPGIAQIMEEVRAEDMPAQTPAVAVAGLEHASGADADLVGRGDLEAGVMEARP